eukprot:sb/3477000/
MGVCRRQIALSIWGFIISPNQKPPPSPLQVRGERYKRAKKKLVSPGFEETAGLIMVDKNFLIEQLDLQTDPGKRAEIQMWIDKYDACTCSSDYSCSEESGSEYTSTPDDTNP